MLPQTQGARWLYQTYIDPFLTEHEAEIDDFIASAHDRARDAGLNYLKSALEYVRVHLLGLQPRRSPQPASQYASSAGSYTQNLLARFYLPGARQQQQQPPDLSAAPASTAASDIYHLITSVLGGSGHGPATSDQGTATSPSSMGSNAERMNYITTQRERLRWLLQALDKEAAVTMSSSSSSSGVSPADVGGTASKAEPGANEAAAGIGPMRKNRSEPDFESVEREDIVSADEKTRDKAKTGTSGGGGVLGGWMPWNWSSNTGGGSGGSGGGSSSGGSGGSGTTSTDSNNGAGAGAGAGSGAGSTPSSSSSPRTKVNDGTEEAEGTGVGTERGRSTGIDL